MRARSLLLLALLAAPQARAEQGSRPPESGPLFALRAGVGFPSGAVSRDGPDLADVVERKLPLALGVGYRFGRRARAQIHVELAPGTPAPELCAALTACTASDVRFGLQVSFRLLPGASMNPWVGVGLGVEVLNAEGRDPATAARTEWSWAGLELPFVEAGADLALSDRIGIGPWMSLGFGQFTSDSVRGGNGQTVSGAVHGRAAHRWLSGGLQATLKL